MVGYAWLLPALPLAGFILLVLLRKRLPGQGGWLAVGLTGFAAALFWLVYQGFQSEGPMLFKPVWFEIGKYSVRLAMVVDPLAVVMLGVVTTCSFLIQIYSLGYMKGDPRFGWFFAVVSLFTAAMLGIVISGNLLILYMCWELVGLCSYLLIGFWFERPAAVEASKKAFITTRIGDVGLFIGILLLFRASGSFDVDVIIHQAQSGAIDPGTVSLAAFLIFLGAMGKSGQFPLHVWLPDAMEGPTPVSALIHAATMVAAGVYLVARTYPLFELAPAVLTFVAVIGLVSTVGASLLALVVTDIKRVLAYSTISQLGLMMLSLGVGGFAAAIFHLTTHAFFKALLFLSAGSVIHGTNHQELDELGGLGPKLRITAVAFLAGGLALAGFPLTSGYISKDEVLGAVLDRNVVAFLFALFGSLLTAFYTFRLWFRIFLGPASQATHHAHESPAIMTIPLVALAVPAIVLGALAFTPVGGASGLPAFIAGQTGHAAERYESIGSYRAHEHPVAPSPVLLAISAIGSVAGIGVAWVAYVRRGLDVTGIRQATRGFNQLLERRFLVDDLYSWLVTNLVLTLGSFVAWFDRTWVNDVGVNGTGRFPSRTGAVLRLTQTGLLSNYGLVVALGMVAIAVALVVVR